MVQCSQRLKLIPPYLFAEMSRIKAEVLAQGADVIDLGIGDPDLPTPQPIINALKAAVDNPNTHRYDETPKGWDSFLDAAIQWHAREFQVSSDVKQDICQVIGSKEGIAHLIWAYVDPGDVVICPDPGYPVYKVNAMMSGAEVYETPLLAKNAYLPILEDIPTEIAKRAKLFFICYPNNPTGAVADLAFYNKVVDFCRQHDILLVSDMAYAPVTYDGYKSPSALQTEHGKEVCIEFHSLSKMFNMTGWRIGFALGNPDAVQTLQKFKSNIDSKQFPAIAEAAAYGLNHVSNQETLQIYQARRDVLCEGLCSLGWNVQKPNASFYIWAKIPREDMSSSEFAKTLLSQAHILTIPGTGYGPHGEGYIRMSITLSEDLNCNRLREAVRRIEKTGLVTKTPVSV